MAEQADLPAVEDKEEETPGYKPPAEMPVSKILELDKEDESLRKYKEALLGSADADKIIVCKLQDEYIKVMIYPVICTLAVLLIIMRKLRIVTNDDFVKFCAVLTFHNSLARSMG